MRLQKYLAEQGVGSRREIERWIEEGFIKINKTVAVLGVKVAQGDEIEVSLPRESRSQRFKVKLSAKTTRRLIIYHKPLGEICTKHDPEDRKTVFEKLPPLINSRWVMIGRLDINTGGLLLFTDDGEFANQMMHPKFEIEREYLVRVLGTITPDDIKQLKNGIELEDGIARCTHVKLGKNHGANQWLTLCLTEGRHHAVRRMMDFLGLRVNRLIRIRFGDYSLPRDLKPGEFLELINK